MAGFSLSHDERCDARKLATALLSEIEHRGRHATGAAWRGPDSAPTVQKDAVPASRFVQSLALPRNAQTAILHTRWETKGSSRNPANIHPIDVGPILGTHNGCLSGTADDDLFDLIGPEKRIGQVDSEAIFAALTHLPGTAGQILSGLRGSVAVAWIETDPASRDLHVARAASSPFFFAYTEAGSFVYASTETAIRAACRKADVALSSGPIGLPEGVAMTVRDGEIVVKEAFQPARSGSLTAAERTAIGARS